jgi:hypothetical protein
VPGVLNCEFGQRVEMSSQLSLQLRVELVNVSPTDSDSSNRPFSDSRRPSINDISETAPRLNQLSLAGFRELGP